MVARAEVLAIAIIVICGGIGSGKTLLAVKQLITRDRKAYVNFEVNHSKAQRLKWTDLFTGEGKERKINWEFWKASQLTGFDLYLDELTNLVPARRSMSSQNVMLMQWLSQIRKILGSTHENNLYLITQRPDSIDIHFRYMAQWWWQPHKQVFPVREWTNVIDTKTKRLTAKELPLMRVWHEAYRTQDDMLYGVNKVVYHPFIANRYYQYYDTHAIVDFGDEEFIP